MCKLVHTVRCYSHMHHNLLETMAMALLTDAVGSRHRVDSPIHVHVTARMFQRPMHATLCMRQMTFINVVITNTIILIAWIIQGMMLFAGFAGLHLRRVLLRESRCLNHC